MRICKLRIINETGDSKFVPWHIANNEKLMRQMGYKIQHLEEQEEIDNNIDLKDQKIVVEKRKAGRPKTKTGN